MGCRSTAPPDLACSLKQCCTAGGDGLLALSRCEVLERVGRQVEQHLRLITTSPVTLEDSLWVLGTSALGTGTRLGY